MNELKSRRRQIRLTPSQDDALIALARRRGCDVSDLFREAANEHFNLPDDVSQTNQVSEGEYTGGTNDNA